MKADGRKIISMSLYGNSSRYIWGVIRNAQLIPLYFAEWTLRVYIAADPSPSDLAVPPKIIKKLERLGVQIAKVSTKNTTSPRNWRLLVAKDKHVDYFLVRDADTRLSEREAAAIREWLSVAEQYGFVVHCIRDHPNHVDQAIVDGLWGGRPGLLHQLLRQDVTQIMDSVLSNIAPSVNRPPYVIGNFLNEILWPVVRDSALCHDSVSPCDRWTTSTFRRPYPSMRYGEEYVGQKFNAHHEPLNEDSNQLDVDVVCTWDSFHSVVSKLIK